MKNKEIETLKHMIEFYKKFCDGEEELNPIATGKEIKAIEKLLSYIEQLENNRDKAIDINKYIYDNLENMDFGEVKCKINRVSDILKGDSDE